MQDASQDLLSILAVPKVALGRDSGVSVRIGGDADSLARDMAEEMADLIRRSMIEARHVCAIVPVGPVGQYKRLARTVAEERLDCSRITFINMDEFLDPSDRPIDPEHPLSFRGFMDREFYDALPAGFRFPADNRVFPNPRDLDAIATLIRDRGGVDVCWGGIGLNGHLAFNEPEAIDVDAFAALSTRLVDLAPESRAHMAINLACVPEIVPRRAVTVGMREILAARRISIHANRPWQSGVVRLMLHGPISPSCPASLVRLHPDARLTVAEFVAEPREVRLL